MQNTSENHKLMHEIIAFERFKIEVLQCTLFYYFFS
jgi:hypothetical protein